MWSVVVDWSEELVEDKVVTLTCDLVMGVGAGDVVGLVVVFWMCGALLGTGCWRIVWRDVTDGEYWYLLAGSCIGYC